MFSTANPQSKSHGFSNPAMEVSIQIQHHYMGGVEQDSFQKKVSTKHFNSLTLQDLNKKTKAKNLHILGGNRSHVNQKQSTMIAVLPQP